MHASQIVGNYYLYFFPRHPLEKKMQVPGPLGYQTPIGPMMPDQQQGMPGQQAASFYPNMGKKILPLNQLKWQLQMS